jgi:hypothetical protein
MSGAPLRKIWDAWYAWALIAAATLASAYLNAAHAPPRWDARLVAGTVPVALLASVHLLVLLLLRVLAWTTPASATGALVALDQPTPARNGSAPPAAPARLADGARPAARHSLADTRPVYDALAATGAPVTWQRFAAAFDPPMARRTAQRHLAAHGANGQQSTLDPTDTAP